MTALRIIQPWFYITVPEENIATVRYGAQVIRGEMKAALLDGDVTNYDLDRGFTRHLIDDNNGQGIVIRLEQPYIINTIKLLLWDKDTRYKMQRSQPIRKWYLPHCKQ